MDTKTFLENFGVIADAPNGIQCLRSLILDLASTGRLVKSSVKTVQSVSVDAICDYVQRGKSPKYSESGEVKVISQKCVQWTGFDSSLARSISDDSVSAYKEERFLRDGDLLWNSTGTGTLGRTALFQSDGSDVRYVADSHVTILRSSKAEPRYLQIWSASPSIQAEVLESATGSTNQQELNLATVKALTIDLPSREVQRRIVAKVDELMALCDELEAQKAKQEVLRSATRDSAIDAISTATTPEELSTAWSRISNNWDAIGDSPESINKLRQLLISLAVKGLLTSGSEFSDSEQVEPFESSTKLDESKLWLSRSALADVPRGWLRTPMGTLGKWGSGGTPTSTRKEFYENGTVPWAVIGDLNEGELLSTEKSITAKGLAESSATTIPIGSVLIAMYGASIGKTAITGIECTSNQAIAHCIPGVQITGEYLLLLAKSLKSELINSGQGAAQPNISQTVIKHLLVDVPPIKLQLEILAKVDELMALSHELEESLNLQIEIESAFAHASSRLLTI